MFELIDWSGDGLLIEKSIHLRRAPAGGIQRFRGGQWITDALWASEKARAVADLPGLLDRFGDRLQLLRAVYEQQQSLLDEGLTKVKLVPLSTVEAQMKAAVRDAYSEAFLLGKRAAGNLTSIKPSEQAAVKALRIDEFRYLRGFLGDMREGQGRMDYVARCDMYRAAARELYWLGWVLGNREPGRLIAWVLGATEHCADCLRIANAGPYDVERFIREVVAKGFLPNSGRLACLGYKCGCGLKEVKA